MSLFEVIAAMLCISHLSQMDSEEYSLGQEDRIVVIKDVAKNSDQEENEE